jgi:hypothetical protein
MKRFKQFVEELQPIAGTQYGSNDGGVHVDSVTGKKYYVKKYKNPDQAKIEALTGAIYKHMGIKTVNPTMHKDSSISSQWNPNLERMEPNEFERLSPEQANQIGRMYHGAILTKNWDIVGLEHDNILKHNKTNDLHAIDHGGAFQFRARGSHKDYGPDIDEKDSLRNNGGASAHVFNTTFDQHPDAEQNGLDAVQNMDDNHIRNLFAKSGLNNWEDLHRNFMSRKKALLNSYK